MYWDVVEVKPEPGYRLFVRFKDGHAGCVQLQREELTGVLAPLLDDSFFSESSLIAVPSRGPEILISHRMLCMRRSPNSRPRAS
jgi:hypothetical protein